MSKPREPSLMQVQVVNSKKLQIMNQVKVENNQKAPSFTDVRVDGNKAGNNGKMPSRRESEFVYVNPAFLGSVNNVNNLNENQRTNRTPAVPAAPITEVYREQYWACTRWPYTQRVLAIAVGVLLGALIGLIISLCVGDDNHSVVGPIFTRQHTAPD